MRTNGSHDTKDTAMPPAFTSAAETNENAPTLAAQVYQQLRDDIITGRLAPGARLVRRTLAKRFNVSVIPILEALLRLENDGLVDYEEKMGARVTIITPEMLETHRVMRESLEIHMARLFAVAPTKSSKEILLEKAVLVDKYHDFLPGGDYDNIKEFFRVHYDFHLAIPMLAGYPGIVQEMRKVWFRRFMFFSNINVIDTPATGDHHYKLAKKLTAGNPDRAGEAMRLHLGYNVEHYRQAVQYFLSSKDERWRKQLFLIDEDEETSE
ncbi:MAG: GntR family transcriptional regulator [Planctomycetaceae bacterium]|nr:GntR family transcriptional regulator [Planctomycetaceae bacterium]